MSLNQNSNGELHELYDRFLERFSVVEKVWILKKQKNISPLDTARWEEVLSKKKKIAENLWLDTTLVEEIWNTIHKVSLSIEEIVSEKDLPYEPKSYKDALKPLREEIDIIDKDILSRINIIVDTEWQANARDLILGMLWDIWNSYSPNT